MWTRALLKENAKTALSRNYFTTIVVCFITTAFRGAYNENIRRLFDFIGWDWRRALPPALATALYRDPQTFYSCITLIGVLVVFCIANPLSVGLYRYLLENRARTSSFETFFSPFHADYKHIVCALAVRDVKIFLWTLCFIVPGVIKGYQWFFVPYLLAENPTLSTKRAMELSTLMTDGEKLSIFVLQLSFFGWALLSAATFGLAYLFVGPYIEATFTEAYCAMRAKLFALGYTDEYELPGVRRTEI